MLETICVQIKFAACRAVVEGRTAAVYTPHYLEVVGSNLDYFVSFYPLSNVSLNGSLAEVLSCAA